MPASITEEFGQWRAFINGEPQGEPFEDPIRAPKVIFIWHSYREEITRDEYLKRCNLATDPSQPSSEPGKKIDLASEPPLF